MINPRNHSAKGDKLSVRVPASAVMGLKDEAILALLTKGFFGGWSFALEGWVMRTCGGVLPARYAAFKDKPTKKIIWRDSDIPKDRLIPVGDMIFDFALVDKHIRQTFTDPSPSYVDYGFGADHRIFAGSHRFVVKRSEEKRHDQGDLFNEAAQGWQEMTIKESGGEEEEVEKFVELYVECFRCNPMVNRDSWAEYVPWLHYWYAKALWAEAVRAVLRR